MSGAAVAMNVCGEDEQDDCSLGLDHEVDEDDRQSIETVTLWTYQKDSKGPETRKGVPFKVNAQRAGLHSTYIDTILNKTRTSASKNVDVFINSPFATTKATELVATYLNENAEKRERLRAPLRERNLKDEQHCSASDIKLLSACERTQDVTDLINLADYLHIESLFVLACAKIASLVRNQPTEVMKQRLKPEFQLTEDASEDIKSQTS